MGRLSLGGGKIRYVAARRIYQISPPESSSPWFLIAGKAIASFVVIPANAGIQNEMTRCWGLD
jgi:hypothetical protein